MHIFDGVRTVGARGQDEEAEQPSLVSQRLSDRPMQEDQLSARGAVANRVEELRPLRAKRFDERAAGRQFAERRRRAGVTGESVE